MTSAFTLAPLSAQLEALLADRNTPRKVVWRAGIVLATPDGCGTNEMMRRADTSKPTIWRWQERHLDEGVDGLRRDKTRPSRVPPLRPDARLKVLTKTVQETPSNATHSHEALWVKMGFTTRSISIGQVRIQGLSQVDKYRSGYGPVPTHIRSPRLAAAP